jgi:hypothetical protein
MIANQVKVFEGKTIIVSIVVVVPAMGAEVTTNTIADPDIAAPPPPASIEPDPEGICQMQAAENEGFVAQMDPPACPPPPDKFLDVDPLLCQLLARGTQQLREVPRESLGGVPLFVLERIGGNARVGMTAGVGVFPALPTVGSPRARIAVPRTDPEGKLLARAFAEFAQKEEIQIHRQWAIELAQEKGSTK